MVDIDALPLLTMAYSKMAAAGTTPRGATLANALERYSFVRNQCRAMVMPGASAGGLVLVSRPWREGRSFAGLSAMLSSH